MSVHGKCLTALLVMLLGAGCRSGGPWATTSPSRAPDGWSRQEMLQASSEFDRAPDQEVPAGQLRVVCWRVIEDDRPLRVEDAIVLTHATDGRWRLARLFRHPRDPWPRWQLWHLMDVPFVNRRDFRAEPTSAEIGQFLDDVDWLPLSEGFRVLDAGGD